MPQPILEAIEGVAPKTRLLKLDLVLICLAAFVAAFFRLYQIDAIPPGLHYDEAFEGLVARQLLETGRLKIFFEGNFGLEPLSVYMLAGLYLLFGVSATTIRLMPAIAGILTVPALYLLVREMFPRGPWSATEDSESSRGEYLSRILAFLSAIALAGLYWHVTFSRYGVESNLVPLFEVVAFCFLWHGFRTRRTSSFIMSGIILGLSLYTYQAARMLPVLVALAVVYRLLLERWRFVEAYWKGFTLLAAAAVITFAPLGDYFIRHPDFLTLRAGQVSALSQQQDTVQSIVDNAGKSLGMFLVRGDEDPRSNLPGRPAVDWIFALPFLLGAMVVVPRLGRPQYGFLVVWFIVMLVPTVLSEHAPHFRRSLGVTPVLAIVIALGLTSILTAGFWTADRLRGRSRGLLRGATVSIVVAAVAVSSYITFRDYFQVWGQSKELFSAFDVGIMDAIRHVNGLSRNTRILMSPVPSTHPTIEFAIGPQQRVKSFDGRRGFVIPAGPDENAMYIVMTNEDHRSLSLLKNYFPQGRPIYEGQTWDGRPYYTFYFVPANSRSYAMPHYPMSANLGNKVAFLGYNTPRFTYRPGDVIPLVLYWRALSEMNESYTVFTHLIGPWDDKNKTVVWGQQDSLPIAGAYLTSDWDKDDIVLDEYAIPVKINAPAGDYEIEVGMYRLDNMRRLSVLDPVSGEKADDRVVLGKFRIDKP